MSGAPADLRTGGAQVSGAGDAASQLQELITKRRDVRRAFKEQERSSRYRTHAIYAVYDVGGQGRGLAQRVVC